MEKTSEKVVNFNGMPVVDHVVVIDNEGNKSEAWLTPIEGFTATKNALGADTLDTNEDNSRVYLFKGDELVGDYRLTNKLKGSTPEELIKQAPCLCFFKSWYAAENRWVNQCAKGTPRTKSEKAKSI